MAKSKYLVDSNVLIGFFDKNDRQNKRAREKFVQIRKDELILILHPLVYIETVSIIKYAQNRGVNVDFRKSKKGLDDAKVWTLVNWEGIDLKSKCFKLFNKKNRLGLIDAMLIYECLDNDYELVTFDKEMEKVYLELKK